VERNQLESIVRFSGWLNASDVERAYSEADVLVLPSWAEGLPNVMIEAMATRLAVIVSAVGNIPDMVVDGHEAMFITPRDVDDLKSKMARVISEPVLRRQLGDAAFSMVERQFGVEQAANRILAAVEEVLD